MDLQKHIVFNFLKRGETLNFTINEKEKLILSNVESVIFGVDNKKISLNSILNDVEVDNLKETLSKGDYIHHGMTVTTLDNVIYTVDKEHYVVKSAKNKKNKINIGFSNVEINVDIVHEDENKNQINAIKATLKLYA